MSFRPTEEHRLHQVDADRSSISGAIDRISHVEPLRGLRLLLREVLFCEEMGSRTVVVAVEASKEITQYALEWAVRNVIRPHDSLFLLAVLPLRKHPPDSERSLSNSQSSKIFSCRILGLLKKLGLRRNKDSPSSDTMALINGVEQDMVRKVNVVCELTLQQLFLSHNLKKVHGEVRVVADAHLGSVASVAGELGATWVILDRHLKKEGDSCLKKLICNIVVIDHVTPRILRSINPLVSKEPDTHIEHSDATVNDGLGMVLEPSQKSNETSTITQSSLGFGSPDQKRSPSSHANVKPKSSYIHLNSQYFPPRTSKDGNDVPSPSKSKPETVEKRRSFHIDKQPQRPPVQSSDGKRRNYSGPLKTGTDTKKPNNLAGSYALPGPARRSVDSQNLLQLMNLRSNPPNKIVPGKDSPAIERTSSIRRAMDLSIKHPPTPPPLCSVCKHNTPHFGKAPRKFTYKEIETATDQFSAENFLAKGGFGSVYKGVLPDGQVIAVKQHKSLTAQGASEFCSEVEVLSCAQHKNLVMLVGYCIETQWLLVYEFVCNGSLEKHLHGQNCGEVMAWDNRMKAARGAARGLRYLHEDCRVGCIVHRDFRPSNILLTHDFEPMVGDFGLARWQADGQLAEEMRIVGAFGYLAPEYIQTGLVTEKNDVYAYGIVLLELLSGYKATEFSRKTGKQFVSEWGLPLLQGGVIKELIDPRLVNCYAHKEVKSVIRAAQLCLSPDPQHRPRMSQVLKILDGDVPSNAIQLRQLMTSTTSHKNSEEIIGDSTKVSDADQEEKDGCCVSNQTDSLVVEEYQAYLQGSLAKFIQSMNKS